MSTTRTVARMAAVWMASGLLFAACAQASPSTSGAGSAGARSATPPATTIGTDRADRLGTVLASAGRTLYHNTKESGGTIVCTGTCASTWPPVVVTGAVPMAPKSVHGSFGTVARPDGTTQLTFDGLPLYTYAGDGAPGQATGQGLDGVWFAVGPNGSIGTSSGGSSTGSSPGGMGGYGYGR